MHSNIWELYTEFKESHRDVLKDLLIDVDFILEITSSSDPGKINLSITFYKVELIEREYAWDQQVDQPESYDLFISCGASPSSDEMMKVESWFVKRISYLETNNGKLPPFIGVLKPDNTVPDCPADLDNELKRLPQSLEGHDISKQFRFSRSWKDGTENSLSCKVRKTGTKIKVVLTLAGDLESFPKNSERHHISGKKIVVELLDDLMNKFK